MEILKKIWTNGYGLILPILLWNAFFYRYLPPAYDIKSFNANIPQTIFTGELIGRILIFGLPLFIQLNYRGSYGRIGLLIYLLGIFIYFSSWIAVIAFPQSSWTKSVFGFAAPAYSIIIWLIGLSLLSETFYFRIPFARLSLLLSSLIMTGFHSAHAIYVWYRTYH